MSPKPASKWIHHSAENRPHGCLPLFFLLVLIPIFSLLFVARVQMPEAPVEAGEGSIYQHSTPFMYSHARMQSQLPMNLPAFADPAKAEEFGSPLLFSSEAQLSGAPAITPYYKSHNSVILAEQKLLQLPQRSDEESKKDKPQD